MPAIATTYGSLSSEEEQEVKAQIYAFYEAVRRGDESYFDRHFHHLHDSATQLPGTPGPTDDSVFIGTAPHELVRGHEGINPYWSELFGALQGLPGAPGLDLYPDGGLPITKGTLALGRGNIDAIRIAGCSSESFKIAWVVDTPTVTLNGTENTSQLPPYNSRLLKCRFTAVLQYPAVSAIIDNHSIRYWMITQAHLSIGVNDEYLPIALSPTP